MRYLLVLLILIPSLSWGQNKKLSELPANSVFQLNDIFWSYDGGVTSTKTTGAVLMAAVHDTADKILLRMADSVAAIRVLAMGSSAFSKSLHRVFLTDIYDSLGIGTTDPTHMLSVIGNADVTNLYTNRVYLGLANGSTAYMWGSGDDLVFYDESNGLWTLTNILSGMPFERGTTTNQSREESRNWNFGGRTGTTYKVNVEGTLRVRDTTYQGGPLRFKGAGGAYGPLSPKIMALDDTMWLSDATGEWSLAELVGGSMNSEFDTIHIGALNYLTEYNDFTIDFETKDPGNATLRLNASSTPGINDAGTNGISFAPNYIDFLHGTAHYYFDGSYWRSATDTLATNAYARAHGTGGEGGGLGTVGTPVAAQIAVFNNASSLLGDPYFIWGGDTKTNGAFYYGEANPDYTGASMKYNGEWYASRGYFGGLLIGWDPGTSPGLYSYASDKIGVTAGLRVTTSADTLLAMKRSNGSDVFIIVGDSVYLKKNILASDEYLGTTPTGALIRKRGIVTVPVIVTDTIPVTTSGDTKYIVPILDALAGKNLIKVEASCGNSAGNKVPTFLVFRDRGGTENQVTSVGANFTTNATINTSYDDMAKGDRLKVVWSLGSGTTAPYGMIVNLTFQKP